MRTRLTNSIRYSGLGGLLWVLLPVLMSVLMLITAGCASWRDPRAPVSLRFEDTVDMPDLDALERRIHHRVNQVRRHHQLPALKWDDDLAMIARNYSMALRRAGRLSHTLRGSTLESRYQKASYTCRVPVPRTNRVLTGGENLALIPQIPKILQIEGRPDRPVEVRTLEEIVADTVNGWMNSPAHRENLLLPHWRRQGIGVVIDRDHRLWITQNLC